MIPGHTKITNYISFSYKTPIFHLLMIIQLHNSSRYTYTSFFAKININSIEIIILKYLGLFSKISYIDEVQLYPAISKC